MTMYTEYWVFDGCRRWRGHYLPPVKVRAGLMAFILALLLALPVLGAERGMGIIAAPDGKTVVGEQHLFAIAINRYEQWNPIAGAVPEAEKLVDVLTQQYAFSRDRTVFLKDRHATRGAIARQFDTYRKTLEPADSLLVLYCGHGHLDEASGSGYWIPVDGGLDPYEQEKWLHNSTLRGYLKNIPARHILVVADSCFSGQLLDATRARPQDITNEYYRRAYQRMARQVLTSGGTETVADASAFGDALYNELLANRDPWIDPAKLFVNVRAAVKGQQPLLGALKASGHQDGGSFIFFRRQTTAPPPPPPGKGTLVLVCKMAGTLSIDGKRLGRVKADAQYRLPDIAAGQRQLHIDSDAGAWTQTVIIVAGQTAMVETTAPEKKTAPKPADAEWEELRDQLTAMLDRFRRVDGGTATERLDGIRRAIANLEGFLAKYPRDNHPKVHDMARTRLEWFRDKLPLYEAAAASAEDSDEPEKPALEKGPTPGSDLTVPEIGMEFVWVPALKCWVGKYEVTNGEYRKKEPKHDSKDYEGHSLNGDRQPVVYVNFDDAKAYATWLTERERRAGRLPGGAAYRLPTEKEWETFASCGDDRKYPWGNDWPPRYGNYCGQESALTYKIDNYRDGHAVTCPVEQSAKNDWGLYGVGGNVWECTLSNGVGSGAFGAWRGASWFDGLEVYLRVGGLNALYRGSSYGFRLLLSPAGP